MEIFTLQIGQLTFIVTNNLIDYRQIGRGAIVTNLTGTPTALFYEDGINLDYNANGDLSFHQLNSDGFGYFDSMDEAMTAAYSWVEN